MSMIFWPYFILINSCSLSNPLILFLSLQLSALNSYNHPELNYLSHILIFLLAHLPYLLHIVPTHYPSFYKSTIQLLSHKIQCLISIAFAFCQNLNMMPPRNFKNYTHFRICNKLLQIFLLTFCNSHFWIISFASWRSCTSFIVQSENSSYGTDPFCPGSYYIKNNRKAVH